VFCAEGGRRVGGSNVAVSKQMLWNRDALAPAKQSIQLVSRAIEQLNVRGPPNRSHVIILHRGRRNM
jgi:hypothetical protein